MDATGGVAGFSGDALMVQSGGFHGAPGGVFAVTLEAGGNAIYLNYTPGGGSFPGETWLAANFSAAELSDVSISGWNADADSDGFPTLLEYALGGDPKERDDTIEPLLEISAPAGNPDDPRLSFSFTRLLDRTDIDCYVQAADSLEGAWTNVGEIVGGTAPVALNGGVLSAGPSIGNLQNVTFSDTVLVRDAGKRFMRLEIVKRP